MSDDFALPRALGDTFGKRKLLTRAIESGNQETIQSAALTWASAAGDLLRFKADGRDPGTLANDVAFEIEVTRGLVDTLLGPNQPAATRALDVRSELLRLRELIPLAQQPPRERLN